MTVQTERASDGHMTFRLGPVERWVVILCVSLLLWLCRQAYTTLVDRMEAQAKGQQDIVTQMAVMNANYTVIIRQLADVPGLTTRVTTIETKQSDLLRRQEHDEELREATNNGKLLKEWRR